MLKYSVSIRWSDNDKGFIAVVPELPGLSAFGANQAEALSELKIASAAYLKSLKGSGRAVPAPLKTVTFSGQLRLRMPKSLHAEFSESARAEGTSLNTYLVALLTQRHAERATTLRIADRQALYSRR